jgi:hypothetical protein
MADHTTNFKDFKQSASQSDKFAAFFVFLVWPLLGLILSFKHYKFKNSVNVIWLFSIFVGMTFGFPEGTDSTRYALNLIQLHSKTNYSFSEFWEYLNDEGSNSIDIVQPIVNFLVSRISDSKYVLFGIYGLIFGFFYSRNVWFLIDKVKDKIKIEAFAFLVLFTFLVPFWSMNGFRFWTATHIFFYGMLRYFSGRKVNGLLWMFSSLLVHYTYILAVIIFLGYLIGGNRLRIYFGIYFISIFFSFIDISIVSDYAKKLPGNYQERSSGYLDEEYAATYFESFEETRWFIKYRYDFIKLLVIGSFSWIFFARRKLIIQYPMMLKLFSIGLLFMAFANFTASVPSMLRFYFIGFMSVTLMLFLFFQLLQFKRRPDWYKVSSVVFVFLFCLVEVRVGLTNLTLASALGNPLTFTLFDRSQTLLEFIKGAR